MKQLKYLMLTLLVIGTLSFTGCDSGNSSAADPIDLSTSLNRGGMTESTLSQASFTLSYQRNGYTLQQGKARPVTLDKRQKLHQFRLTSKGLEESRLTRRITNVADLYAKNKGKILSVPQQKLELKGSLDKQGIWTFMQSKEVIGQTSWTGDCSEFLLTTDDKGNAVVSLPPEPVFLRVDVLNGKMYFRRGEEDEDASNAADLLGEPGTVYLTSCEESVDQQIAFVVD